MNTPTHIGEFRIETLLGSGGMGTVFSAIDTKLGRRVAIKTLRSDIAASPGVAERFRSEGHSLARLSHQNITVIYDMPRIGNDVCLVMEFVRGHTVDAILNRLQRLGLQETLAIVSQAAAGLDYAHRMDIIHRDIKPSNLMVTEVGLVKVMDFGIARIRGTQRLTQAGLVGTWAYLAPEQFRRSEGSERSDVYSFACVVYEMLTGRVPFEAPSEAEMMRGHLDLPPPPLAAILPQIDQRVNDAVLKALSKEPTMRFASIGEFAEALGAVAQERVSTATIRDRILSRMPMLPPLPPIEISEPGATHRDAVTFGRTGTHSGTHAGAGRKNWLIPGLLGSAGIAALAAIGFVVLGSRPPPALPVLDNEPEPHIAPHTPVPPNPQPPPIVPVVRQDQTALIPPTPQGSATPAFVRSQGVKPLASLSVTELMQQNLTPELIMAEAERRIASGGAQPVTDGLALLKYLVGPPFHNPQAAAKLAQLYDPLQTSRPPGLSPSADLAAMNYGIASRNGDQKAADEREKLRQYLQQQSQGSGQSAASATTLLRRYWPQ